MSKKDLSASSSHTTRKHKSNCSSGEVLKILLVVLFAEFCAWAYKATVPPPPKKLGPPDGLPLTSPRIQLRDGRHLSYREHGVSKEVAKSKIIYVHCFDCSKYNDPFVFSASPAVIEELGVYIVAFDRPGYGESDPNPKRTVKSLALDIEELADELNLGERFYVVGFSMGGQVIWSCLKYIPHRLAGAVLLSPAVNYWWHNLPSKLTNEAYSRLLQQDQWSFRVAHYLPWLTYWWNTQLWFPGYSVITKNPAVYSLTDIEVAAKLNTITDPYLAEVMRTQPRLQGEFESIYRDMNIGWGKWEFDPIDIQNPFQNVNGTVHLWMGDDDRTIPVTLQRYIAQQLGWIKYHEIVGVGHTFSFADEMGDNILRALLGSN
ncbi:hypothetical protein E3N88_07270 [Mikania micrantha]|uniref:AB hydrolase-1 domain-containing protein n=1 Tax=Mikania micrantha TaxID=192012 RepID=A0A5N6PR30_9ASTR|nr:hypothetical protein E3N88_07270 [Mikania micrantha]